MNAAEPESALAPTEPAPEPSIGPFYKRWIFGLDPKKTLLRLLILNIISFTIFRVLLMPITVVGTSMRPTYESGEMNFVNRWPYSSRPPQRGDVVAVRVAHGVLYVKRVMGLPGETVAIRRGRLSVNNQLIDDPHGFSRVRARVAPVRLDPDEYFVIGDNREVTVFGVVKANQIVGKVVF